MASLPTCTGCGQTYTLGIHNTVAIPGYLTVPTMVTVPNEDVNGVVHGTRRTATSRWITQGKPIPVNLAAEDTDDVRSWACPCGSIVQVREPGTERVACTYQAPSGGVCRVRSNQVAPPPDRYTNARHGASCPCCGHQGTHEVRLDRQGVLPPCQK